MKNQKLAEEFHTWRYFTKAGEFYGECMTRLGAALFTAARKVTRQGHLHCTWCGQRTGFACSVSRLGLRCDDCNPRMGR